MNTQTTNEKLKNKVTELEKELAQVRQSERNLIDKHKRLETLLSVGPAVIYSSKASEDFGATFISKNIKSQLGYEPHEFIEDPRFWGEHIHPEDRSRIFSGLEGLLEEGSHVHEYRFKNKEGNYRWMRDEIVVVYGSDGNPTELIGFWIDITDRRQIEDTLKERETFLNVIFDAIQDGISVLDTDFNVIRVNKVMREWYSHMLPFEGKKKCYEVYHNRSEPCEVCPTIQTIKSGNLVKEEVSFTNEKAVIGTLEVFAFPIIDKSGKITGVVEYVRDVTDQRKAQKSLEEETIKIQKLESTGVLAGGIAHDFNNILTAIFGSISIAKMYSRDNKEIIKILTVAEKAAVRAGDLSQQLLTFSKGGKPIKKVTELAQLIKESALFALTGSQTDCNLHMVDNPWLANIDEGQISQVIQNVVKNADQAMPDGGTITIKAENKTISYKASLPLKEGKYICIRIDDQGAGIQQEHLNRVFDPYFSTKKEGSGLGLAASFSIINKHDGFITAESELGIGTTFYVYLPASKEQSLVRKIREKEKVHQSGEKILVMDDDQAVLEIVTQMLELMGFEVGTATNGQEAVEFYRKAQIEARPFDAVILDLTVPGGMGGRETIKQLTGIDPGVNALVSSGYANDPVMADYELYGFKGVVPKPYDMEKLGKVLRHLFD